MRTDIFNKFVKLSDDFIKDFDLLWEAPPDQQQKLLLWVPQIYRAEVVAQKNMLFDRAVSDIGGDAKRTLKVLRLLLFIYGQWHPVNDNAEIFIRDMSELGLIPAKNKDQAERFLLEFLHQVQQDNQRRLEKMHAASILPNYLGSSTLIDFRAVISNPFGVGLENKIADYDPTCISFVPVVIVQIRSSDNDPGEFVFQCEEEELDMIINQLNAAKKELNAAKRALPGGASK